MGRARRMPDDATLRRWYLDEKLTYQQMADRWSTYPDGDVATRQAFTNRCKNADWYVPRQLKHAGTPLCPWKNIRPEHMDMHDIQMLRKESARRLGKKLTPETTQRLNAWLQGLAADDAVIAYMPDTIEGWWHVKRRYTDKDIVRLPKEYRDKQRALRGATLRKVG